MKIAIASTGYVGLSLAVLLAQHNEVTALDIVREKEALLNHKQSAIKDTELEDFLAHKPLNLRATLDKEEAFAGADYVIIATPTDQDHADLLRRGAIKRDITTLFIDSTEAEAIKLCSNAYLAMRVAYFNELDTHAVQHGLNPHQIINGVCLGPRIGARYNSPRFDCGGYCLPEDTTDPKVATIYRRVMKTESDNFRVSSIQGFMKCIQAKAGQVIMDEPAMYESTFFNSMVVSDSPELKWCADSIVSRRMTNHLVDVADDVYTHDLFGGNA
ncbi:UDP-glucose 6-dehydrogenase family protein [Paraburkholderia caffeinilytica]|uniref:hypothetical protein n=1 Tax=Paraburkholderia caffeinilytica TaxID=1761016 RepID=UPI0038B99B60